MSPKIIDLQFQSETYDRKPKYFNNNIKKLFFLSYLHKSMLYTFKLYSIYKNCIRVHFKIVLFYASLIDLNQFFFQKETFLEDLIDRFHW